MRKSRDKISSLTDLTPAITTRRAVTITSMLLQENFSFRIFSGFPLGCLTVILCLLPATQALGYQNDLRNLRREPLQERPSSYSFGYNSPTVSRSEIRDLLGNVQGGYFVSDGSSSQLYNYVHPSPQLVAGLSPNTQRQADYSTDRDRYGSGRYGSEESLRELIRTEISRAQQMPQEKEEGSSEEESRPFAMHRERGEPSFRSPVVSKMVVNKRLMKELMRMRTQDEDVVQRDSSEFPRTSDLPRSLGLRGRNRQEGSVKPVDFPEFLKRGPNSGRREINNDSTGDSTENRVRDNPVLSSSLSPSELMKILDGARGGSRSSEERSTSPSKGDGSGEFRESSTTAMFLRELEKLQKLAPVFEEGNSAEVDPELEKEFLEKNTIPVFRQFDDLDSSSGIAGPQPKILRRPLGLLARPRLELTSLTGREPRPVGFDDENVSSQIRDFLSRVQAKQEDEDDRSKERRGPVVGDFDDDPIPPEFSTIVQSPLLSPLGSLASPSSTDIARSRPLRLPLPALNPLYYGPLSYPYLLNPYLTLLNPLLYNRSLFVPAAAAPQTPTRSSRPSSSSRSRSRASTRTGFDEPQPLGTGDSLGAILSRLQGRNRQPSRRRRRDHVQAILQRRQ